MASLSLESILQDIRLALRGFRRNLTFSAAAVLVMALGTGAATAVFSVVDRLLFRSLPYAESNQIVSVGVTIPWMDGEFLIANDYLHLREHMTMAFSALTSWTGVADCDLSDQNAPRVACAQTDSWFLPTFGISPLLGRNFRPEEDRPNVPKVALLSWGLWRSRFGGDPRVLGKTIRIDGSETEIIGVLRPDFEFPNLAHVDLLVPQAVAILQYRRGESGRPLRVFGRLKDGITGEQARSIVQAYLLEGWQQMFSPEQLREVHTVVRSLRDYQIQNAEAAAWLLFGATAGVLLIVSANVANLLLTRSHSRQHELATRTALGATRMRLVRQTFTECWLLCCFGATLGSGLAQALLTIFKMLAPVSIPRLQEAALDGRVLAFACLATLLCAVIFAIPAALAIPDAELLAAGSRVARKRRNSLSHVMILAQVAVSLVLLSLATLLLESLWNLQRVAPGIAVDHVITADIAVPSRRYPNTVSRQQFFDHLANRLRRLPGVKAVAISDTAPPTGFVHNRPLAFFQVAGAPMRGSEPTGIVAWRSVTADYFAALGIPILRGRGFEESDSKGQDHVIVVSTALMHRLFPHDDPIGKTLRLNPKSPVFTVVGVVPDVKNNGVSQPSDPEYYIPRKEITDPNVGLDESIVTRSLHLYDGEAFLIVRSASAPGAVADWIRSETAALDASVPVTISTMAERIRGLSERPRFTAALLSFFAFVGVTLAATGLYGLISFLAVQRTQEIGVRVAIGATPFAIFRLMLAHALGWTAAGIAIGMAASAAAVRALHSLFFHVSPESPMLFGAVASLIILVAIGAVLRPAVKAARIDPLTALRHE